MKYGRKFWLAAAAFATFTGLLIHGDIGKGEYVTLAMFALGGYLGANVIQKATAKKALDA
ncbi:MAG: hypothetical protein EOO23_06165 [Comamonadaceae bacterium]|nr:MAG: hypothetical protein EOO23_06165 [Comamonadaceae bacterium]